MPFTVILNNYPPLSPQRLSLRSRATHGAFLSPRPLSARCLIVHNDSAPAPWHWCGWIPPWCGGCCLILFTQGLPAQDTKELTRWGTGGDVLIPGPGPRTPATPITPALPYSFGHCGNLCAFGDTCPHKLNQKATSNQHYGLLQEPGQMCTSMPYTHTNPHEHTHDENTQVSTHRHMQDENTHVDTHEVNTYVHMWKHTK